MTVNSKKQFFHAKIVIVVGDDSSLVAFPRKTPQLAGLHDSPGALSVNTVPSASEVDRPLLTRRQWLRQAPASALATPVPISLLGESALQANPIPHASSAMNLG